MLPSREQRGGSTEGSMKEMPPNSRVDPGETFMFLKSKSGSKKQFTLVQVYPGSTLLDRIW